MVTAQVLLLALLLATLNFLLSDCLPAVSRFNLVQTTNVTVTCNAYCNGQKEEVPAQECQGGRFCCGNPYDKFCCDDFAKAIYSDTDPPANGCSDNPSWWYYQWRLIIGVLCILMAGLLVMVIYFCVKHYGCFCFKSCQRNQNDEDQPQLELSSQGLPMSARGSQYACGIDSPVLEPPPYDEATVEPPKYSELYGDMEFNSEEVSPPVPYSIYEVINDTTSTAEVSESGVSDLNINTRVETESRCTVQNSNTDDVIGILNTNIDSASEESIPNTACGILNAAFIIEDELPIDRPTNTQDQAIANASKQIDSATDVESDKVTESINLTDTTDQQESCQSIVSTCDHVTGDDAMTSAEQNEVVRLSLTSESDI